MIVLNIVANIAGGIDDSTRLVGVFTVWQGWVDAENLLNI